MAGANVVPADPEVASTARTTHWFVVQGTENQTKVAKSFRTLLEACGVTDLEVTIENGQVRVTTLEYANVLKLVVDITQLVKIVV